jgi:hypothetical protein
MKLKERLKGALRTLHAKERLGTQGGCVRKIGDGMGTGRSRNQKLYLHYKKKLRN